MPPLQQSYKLNWFCLKVIPVPDHSKEYQCLIPTPKILISVPVTKYRECDFSFLFPSPYKPGGRGAMCPSWLPYSTDSYLHILVFVFVSCVSQFAKFCKLWARQRRQVFLCVTICKILQIAYQTTITRCTRVPCLKQPNVTFPTRITIITGITGITRFIWITGIHQVLNNCDCYYFIGRA